MGASPRARAENVNLRILALARQHPGQRLSPVLGLFAVIREPVARLAPPAE